jgi:hypothetical protein
MQNSGGAAPTSGQMMANRRPIHEAAGASPAAFAAEPYAFSEKGVKLVSIS